MSRLQHQWHSGLYPCKESFKKKKKEAKSYAFRLKCAIVYVKNDYLDDESHIYWRPTMHQALLQGLKVQ